MFPFLNNNGYMGPHFSYNINYDNYRQSQLQENSYLYPFIHPNFQFQHQSPVPNYMTHIQPPYFFQRNQQFISNDNFLFRRKKRITKKLSLIEIKKKIRSLTPQFKIKRKAFKYFDPCRAPPITSLRNQRQLQLDLKLQQRKTRIHYYQESEQALQIQKASRKLQLLMKQPSEKFYPFLICKKRKYHRNLKRRYSVAYFQQRAAYIINKQPIPPSLHPKNKVRKPRTPKNNMDQISQSSQESNSSSYSESIEDYSRMQNESQKFKQMKIENHCQMDKRPIKQEISNVRALEQNI